ncbi:hypothetical protein NEF87_004296 [Candidatus Lokiarchaeum ossiferum]|uniref:ATP-grasp domain-containing protein n=1 Tax=Candidatus Lokiarchaeum ossiferum TaxID=2951803 RepID=A0ABY6HWV6_9ARCH|nr:hypothetical protein NEF87_004296 [Candidatus Lokiarchaeum sp. B-35]
MKIAIHCTEKENFCQDWIKYCINNKINYKKVNCLSANIFKDLDDCDILLWHWNHLNYSQYLIAKEFLFIIEFYSDISIFPNFKTGWHFDDKIAQSILLERIQAPIPKYWTFFDEKSALEHKNEIEYPVVFKLRKGSGSSNVKLIKNKSMFEKEVKMMFSIGKNPTNNYIGDAIKKKGIFTYLKHILKIGLVTAIKRYFKFQKKTKSFPKERDYFYIQEFIKDCDRDYRVIVIGDYAYAFERFVRKNDFRASGSGKFRIDQQSIDKNLINIGFKIADKLNTDCITFDFVKSGRGYVILEISYGFVPWKWESFWNRELKIIQEPLNPVDLIIKNIIQKHNSNH